MRLWFLLTKRHSKFWWDVHHVQYEVNHVKLILDVMNRRGEEFTQEEYRYVLSTLGKWSDRAQKHLEETLGRNC